MPKAIHIEKFMHMYEHSNDHYSTLGILPSCSIKSARTIAVAASTITGARSATHKSCLPFTEKCSIFPVSQLRLNCSFGVDAVGFTAILNTSRSEEHTSELQSRENLVCRLLLEKKK